MRAWVTPDGITLCVDRGLTDWLGRLQVRQAAQICSIWQVLQITRSAPATARCKAAHAPTARASPRTFAPAPMPPSASAG